MFLNIISALVAPVLLLTSAAQATMVDKSSVGCLTGLEAKSTICNVLDYGGVADNKTDIALAIQLAFSSCASKGGATLYIPPGNYLVKTSVVLSKGSNYAIQIDGLITLASDGDFKGNAFIIKGATDVEVFSSNGLGAINGQGYITRLLSTGQNARLMRFISCKNLSVHDLIFVDSPTFHLIFNGVSNLEAYHITIRGPDIGGTDGIDLLCDDNCYLHHIEVTNRDECISVKSPSLNVLIEEVYCNRSGGMSIGSVTADGVTEESAAAISNITMRNIYSHQCTQMLMIKTYPGGSGAVGHVKDSLFENFWAYDSTYGLDIDQYWQYKTTPNTGAVQLSDLTFNNWTGSVNDGVQRAPIVIRGSDIVPLKDITLSNFNMWTENKGKILNKCNNVYGTGYCAAQSTQSVLATFTTTATTTSPPAGYTAPTKPAWGLETGYGKTIPIPVYTPAAFWAPVSSGVASTAEVVVKSSGLAAITASAPVSSSTAVKSASSANSDMTSVSDLTTSAFASVKSSSSIEAISTSSVLSSFHTATSTAETVSSPETSILSVSVSHSSIISIISSTAITISKVDSSTSVEKTESISIIQVIVTVIPTPASQISSVDITTVSIADDDEKTFVGTSRASQTIATDLPCPTESTIIMVVTRTVLPYAATGSSDVPVAPTTLLTSLSTALVMTNTVVISSTITAGEEPSHVNTNPLDFSRFRHHHGHWTHGGRR